LSVGVVSVAFVNDVEDRLEPAAGHASRVPSIVDAIMCPDATAAF